MASYTSPDLLTNYTSVYERADTAFDSTAAAATDVFLDSLLQNDILPPKVASLFSLVSFI